jgi:glycerol-3-phosphate O-acyltransferase
MAVARRDTSNDDLLTGPPGSDLVYLLDAGSDFEADMLEKWVHAASKGEPRFVRLMSSRRGHAGDTRALQNALASKADPYLIPLRVVWLAPGKDGNRSVGWSDAFKPGDPRDPRGMRARLIRLLRPGRVRLTAAPGAKVSELAKDYDVTGGVEGFSAFVTRRAWRVLDRAERRLHGNRYKIPRFVPETILARREFIDAVEAHAIEHGEETDKAIDRAERYLREIAATHSPYVIDLIANAIHSLYKQGYSEIRYDDDEVTRIAELSADHPIVFLPSHRSNLDRLSLQFMLWENDLPPNHTAGGINLDFFPIGPLIRRTGVFFIRRSFKENELYKIVLRSYIDFLIEKRFPIEWYMEGGRSRSGRLNPPRFGLLAYVVDSLRRGKSDDIMLVPVSIAYDQIQDVPDYAREAQGKGKEEESIGWLFRAIKSLRRRYGDIHIRFGDPISVASVIENIEDTGDEPIGLQKLAFEVMYRIGRVTPITPIAVVSIALLAARGRARTAAQIAESCAVLTDYIRARNLPTTERLDLTGPEEITAILDWLAEHGNVSSHSAVGRRVFWLDDEQMIRISYYRNMVVHFFVRRAIAEMAISSLIDDGLRDPHEARQRMLAYRDLLKFEFFFPEKDQFLENVEEDLSIDVPDWEENLMAAGPLGVLAKMGDPVAFWSVLPFLDAYQIVGDELESLTGQFDEEPFLAACLDRARLYRIEERLISGESASQVLFKSALSLARNRALLEEGEDIRARRARFAEEIRQAREQAALGLVD